MDTVSVEVIKASPSSAEALAAEIAFQWELPGRAVVIPADDFCKESFQDSLASFLETASIETMLHRLIA